MCSSPLVSRSNLSFCFVLRTSFNKPNSEFNCEFITLGEPQPNNSIHRYFCNVIVAKHNAEPYNTSVVMFSKKSFDCCRQFSLIKYVQQNPIRNQILCKVIWLYLGENFKMHTYLRILIFVDNLGYCLFKCIPKPLAFV